MSSTGGQGDVGTGDLDFDRRLRRLFFRGFFLFLVLLLVLFLLVFVLLEQPQAAHSRLPHRQQQAVRCSNSWYRNKGYPCPYALIEGQLVPWPGEHPSFVGLACLERPCCRVGLEETWQRFPCASFHFHAVKSTVDRSPSMNYTRHSNGETLWSQLLLGDGGGVVCQGLVNGHLVAEDELAVADQVLGHHGLHTNAL